MKKISKSVLSLPRYSKITIAILSDVAMCFVCTWIAFVIKFEQLILFSGLIFLPTLLSVMIAIPIFWIFGLYKTIFRYTGTSIVFNIALSILVYGILYLSIFSIYNIHGIPRIVGFIQPIILFCSLLASRLFIRHLLNFNYSFKKSDKKNILIYGAGEVGRQLILSLENSSEFKVVGFLDDNQNLQKKVILGQTVYAISKLESLILNKNVTFVFLAMPKIGRNKRNKIIESLSKYKIKIKTLPSISEIVGGKITISDIKDFNINDLLDRDEVKPDKDLLKKNIDSKIVLVTGAGGSIGSELCRQISKLNPCKLLLFELNEFALYKIYDQLINLNCNFQIIPILGNIQDQLKLEKIFQIFKVDTVYHTAAYKHVPLVEENICEGLKNNVFGTLSIAKASISKNVSNLVLISSDKAVRPTNVMGASKRLAELCMQGIYKNAKNITSNFSIVRFGNVLESSGSVIPKFKKQIQEGGPILLTHNDVTRYFMTVSEAAQLVIQAGAMGKESEVFVLDMGESIKIKHLINKIITLSGLTVRDKNNPKGDIEIKTIGLRPGEKLYEELLIGENPKNTSHSKIKKINESYIPFDQLEKEINHLEILIENNRIPDIKIMLNRIEKQYNSNSKIVDNLYIEDKSIITNQESVSSSENNIVKIK